METWRIIIPVVVLVLFTISTWYMTKLSRKDFFDKFVKLLDWENGTKESGQCQSSSTLHMAQR